MYLSNVTNKNLIMIKNLKQNYTIPEETVAQLKAIVGVRGRSAFVAEAIADKLEGLKQAQLQQNLKEGYLDRREEDAEINTGWENATLEGWA